MEGNGAKNENLRKAFALANVALRHRWIVLALPLLAGAITFLRTISQRRTYTAHATFMTQAPVRPAAAGLAAQFGFNLLNNSDATMSPEFYAELITSRPVLQRTVRAMYSVPSGDSAVRTTLAQLYG